jgi:uncharacterized protein (DUF1697 family)
MGARPTKATKRGASRYVALLRGINVGGNNLIKMQDLKACFEGAGLEDVATYIASGNVLFTSNETNRATLTRRIEQALATTFDYRACVVLRSGKDMRSTVDHAPAGFGRQPDKYRYDVVFLKEPLSAAAAMKNVTTRDGVDRAYAGNGVLYFSRLTSRASQSHLGRLASTPVYQSMTIRNWNTTTKLLGLMERAR